MGVRLQWEVMNQHSNSDPDSHQKVCPGERRDMPFGVGGSGEGKAAHSAKAWTAPTSGDGGQNHPSREIGSTAE